MQSVVEFEQEKVNMQKNLDKWQLNRSRCIAALPFQKVKNIYIYIYIYSLYIYSKKKEEEKSVLRQVLPVELKVLPVELSKKTSSSKVLPVELKVLPVELNKKWAVAKSYR